jgi:hypothetical protein
MFKVSGFKVEYECPECGCGYTYKTKERPTDVADIYDNVIKNQVRTTCWTCHRSRMDIRDIIAIHADKVPHRYELLWRCDDCNENWTEHVDLTNEEKRDVNLYMILKAEAVCPDPYCNTGRYYMKRITQVD